MGVSRREVLVDVGIYTPTTSEPLMGSMQISRVSRCPYAADWRVRSTSKLAFGIPGSVGTQDIKMMPASDAGIVLRIDSSSETPVPANTGIRRPVSLKWYTNSAQSASQISKALWSLPRLLPGDRKFQNIPEIEPKARN